MGERRDGCVRGMRGKKRMMQGRRRMGRLAREGCRVGTRAMGRD
jgi:hypothetical protein